MIKAPHFWWRPVSFCGRCFSWIGFLYGWIVSWRLRLVTSKKVPVPVICIGNLSLGGTGKTPVALFLAHYFLAKNKKVGFLTRGYRGSFSGPIQVNLQHHSSKQVGDEPLLLATVAPTWVSRDRVEGAHAMIEKGIELILMDDGYQNPSLYKDLNVVVVDGVQGFGNKEIFPCGPLRESLKEGLKRADAIVLVRSPSAALKQDLVSYEGIVAEADMLIDKKSIPSKKVMAFCGIGNPSKFFSSLEREGITVIEKREFPDHFSYSASDLQDLKIRAQNLGVLLVTTEKDWVRLDPKDQKDILAIPLRLKWRNWDVLERLFLEKIH